MLEIDIKKQVDTEQGAKTLEVKSKFSLNKIHGVFGNSGQGKTTLFNMISGIQKPDSGQIYFNKTAWYDGKENLKIQKRGIGYIFQENSLFPNFSIIQNILFALPAAERSKIDAEELLQKVGLQNLGNKYPSQLSGGQRQRAVIARLLVQKPSLVLIDEPFTGLDFEIKHALFRQIKDLQGEHQLTVLLITHDVDDILNLCDTVHIIQHYKMLPHMEVADFQNYINERIQNL